jgi:hypothetical protein
MDQEGFRHEEIIRQSDSKNQLGIIVVRNKRLLRLARNDNIDKVQALVSLGRVPLLRDDVAIRILCHSIFRPVVNLSAI